MHLKIKNNTAIKIIVKPNSKENSAEYDEKNQVYRVNIKAPAEKNKANIEVIKLFSKLLKRKIKIVKGLKSKEKVLELI